MAISRTVSRILMNEYRKLAYMCHIIWESYAAFMNFVNISRKVRSLGTELLGACLFNL